MRQRLQPTTESVASITASDTVRAGEFESVLIPTIEETQKTHAKVRLLFQLEPNTGFTAWAVWDHTKFGHAVDQRRKKRRVGLRRVSPAE